MSFPHHDPVWVAVAELLAAYRGPEESVLAPDDFWWVVPRLHRYAHAAAPGTRYDWVVVHKGAMAALPRSFLAGLAGTARPVLANEVFVVFCARPHGPSSIPEDDHLRAFQANLEALPETPPPAAAGPVLPEAGVIQQFTTLDLPGLRRAMDGFWSAGGYRYETLRDQAYFAEIDAAILDLAGACAGQRVLDLCCGQGRLGALLPGAEVIGVDLSAVALRLARARHAGQPGFRFAAMDAHALALPDAAFDTVVFVDAIEHVHRAEAVLAEAARVLRPGGRLVATIANRDGLNQRLTRRLGFPEFVTNYQHMREFGWAETRGMLRAAGLEPLRAEGIFLYPYWGVPGVDQAVRHLTDDDPEIVAALRELGRRAGPDYAYAIAVSARRV